MNVKDGKNCNPVQTANLSQHDLGEAFLNMAKELWVTKDRLAIMENVFVERGLLDAETISNFQPDKDVQLQLSDERERYLRSILNSLQPK